MSGFLSRTTGKVKSRSNTSVSESLQFTNHHPHRKTTKNSHDVPKKSLELMKSSTSLTSGSDLKIPPKASVNLARKTTKQFKLSRSAGLYWASNKLGLLWECNLMCFHDGDRRSRLKQPNVFYPCLWGVFNSAAVTRAIASCHQWWYGENTIWKQPNAQTLDTLFGRQHVNIKKTKRNITSVDLDLRRIILNFDSYSLK